MTFNDWWEGVPCDPEDTPDERSYTRRIAEAAWNAAQTQSLVAVVCFIEEGGGTFRTFLKHIVMSYQEAYDQGWMAFTNALDEYRERVVRDNRRKR